ncbi:UDP-glucose 4-epimerase GalE [Caulobacter sp. KR2-114]|uniref:UDP-glucose 4-epimerase GalE n=1 Tax=Caulobacter sp. KR2-114 TaxID=3400912 RepID=UPI003C03E576
METVLVTGGAGYVGAHTCLRLAQAGFRPVTYDNLSNGHRRFVQWGPLEEGDIRDRPRLDEVLRRVRPSAVLHFAALIEVGESVKHPDRFHDSNVAGALTVIEAARAAGVRRVVFSSTCAIYGEPQRLPLDEDHPQAPLNPYGETKRLVEQALARLAGTDGFQSVALRYFNAAGADPEGRIGEAHDPETHAIPLAIQAALGQRPGFRIFGDDYPTRDGTALRDYVHVLDLADAHVAALRYLMGGGATTAFNLGAGVGVTVRELLDAVRKVSGRTFPVETAGRRPGDAPALVADAGRAAATLGWRPTYDLEAIVETAWRWHSAQASGGPGASA